MSSRSRSRRIVLKPRLTLWLVRPPTIFFIFPNEFKKFFKEYNLEVKDVVVIGKAVGEKWKDMSKSDKVPYIPKSQQNK